MVTGFLYTDAVALLDCPRCKAKSGEQCHYPSGGKKWPPHVQRTSAMVRLLQALERE